MRKRWFITLGLCLLGASLGFAKTEKMSLQDLAIPKSLGKITERYVGKSDHWVIQIQDVHAHFTAHENIAAIVEHISQDYGIRNVALEGGWSESSFPKSRALPSSREKQMLARALLEEAHIGGPVYAALFAKEPLHIVGIENQELYLQNLAAYLEHIKSRRLFLSRLDGMEKNIVAEKTSVYNPDLLRFDRALNEFRDAEKAETFLPALVSQAVTLQIDITAYDQVVLFKQILGKESAIKKDKLQTEANRLMQDFKDARISFEEILRGGKITEEKLRYFPQSRQYLELMQLQEKMNHRQFFDQIEKVIQNVEQKLVKTESERDLVERSARFFTARSLVLLQATPDHLISYEKQSAAIQKDMERFGLQEALTLALEFYTFAKKRDGVFFENMTTDPKLQGDLLAVTGGFHTSGLSHLLRKAGISYMVITPELGKEVQDEALYFKRLHDNVPVIQALSQEKNRFAFLDANFPEGIRTMVDTNNISRGVETATRFQLTEGGEAPQLSDETLGSLSHESFIALPDQERVETARNLFEQAKKTKNSIVIVIKSSVLAELLKDPVGRVLWYEVIAPDSSNRVIVLQDSDEYLDATIDVAARIDFLSAKVKIEDILSRNLRAQTAVAVIDNAFFKAKPSGHVVALPENPVSFLLARLLLEDNHIQINIQNDLLQAFHEELVQIFKNEGLTQRYA